MQNQIPVKEMMVNETTYNTSYISHKGHDCKVRVIHNPDGTVTGFICFTSKYDGHSTKRQIDVITPINLTSIENLIKKFWNSGIVDPVFGRDYGKLSAEIKTDGLYKSGMLHKNFELAMFVEHNPNGTVIGYFGDNATIDLTDLDKIISFYKNESNSPESKGVLEPISGSENEKGDEGDKGKDNECTYDSSLDQENCDNFLDQFKKYETDFSELNYFDTQEFVKTFLVNVHRTKLLSIYIDAVRATLQWFDDIEQQKCVLPDLASVLLPYETQLKQLNGNINFVMLSSLDQLLFGVENAGYWRDSFDSPKVGMIIVPPCIGTDHVVIEHGLTTMELMELKESDIEKEISLQCEQRQCVMKEYVRMVVKILDELGF